MEHGRRLVLGLLLPAVLAGTPAAAQPTPPSVPVAAHGAARTSVRTLLWAVDGLSYDAFTEARRRGLFRAFPHAGRHVAPYPSMSHPAWTEVMGANRVFGARGTLRSVEASWFDLDAMQVSDDPRQVFARQASPFNYMRAFDWFFDPITEPLLYFEGDWLADRELADAERDVLERFTGDHHVVFLGGADAIAHTHLGGLHRYLTRLDAMMTRVSDSLAARGDTAVRQFIVSDHGNAGAFREGQPERRLTPVSLDAALRHAGLVHRDTGRLARVNEVSVVTLALASMVNVYFADLQRRRTFANAALRLPGVDLITWLEVGADDRFVIISSADRGEARLHWRSDGAVQYRRVTGNPLAIPDSLVSHDGAVRWVPDAVMRAVTMAGPYPDAPFRLIRSADKQVENAPDLVVNLRDGYCWAGSLGRFVQMVRTHGALSARSTLGLVASTHTEVPAYVRSHDVLQVAGLSERQLFHRALARAPHDAGAVADSLASAPRQIATGRDDDSPDATFLRRVRPITRSAEYFDQETARALAAAVRPTAAAQAARRRAVDRTRAALRQTRMVDGVTGHVDTLLALFDPLPTSLNSDSLTRLLERTEARLRGIPELAPLAALRDVWRAPAARAAPRGSAPNSATAGAGDALRRAAMTAWTLPYYLDAVLTAPESDSITDPRDVAFARQWHHELRPRMHRGIAPLALDSTLPPRLFGEVFKERELLRQVEQPAVATLYDAPVPEVALVYVPGIFGELFDDEIWRRGVRSVREQLGMRTITAVTDGRCSTSDNANALLQQLRDDTERRLARGYARPRYLLVGYSKGGLDALHALARDPHFAERQVAAVVTIATPHGGTPVAERADLPDALLRTVIARPRAATCDTSRAVASLWPATRAAFWSSEGRGVVTQVPVYTLALHADMREAHPWMKLTKRIGRFAEENDGVVARSAARVPEGLPAVHLGDLRGDHIAARSASAFPQESIMESVVLTLNELGALAPGADSVWRRTTAARTPTAVAAPVRPAAEARRAPQRLPSGRSDWHAGRTFRMNQLEALTGGPAVEATGALLPLGIDMRCDHDDMTRFREEYEFVYDAGNGGSEGSATNGFSIATADSESGRACRLRTRRSAMKMTTVAFRFAPAAFPRLTLRLRVDRAVTGVAPDKGGRGRNDATLKLWYVLRDERPGGNGRRLLFGYTWAGRDATGATPAAGSLVEGGASRRRIGFSVLPEARLITIGGPDAEGRWVSVERDFASDVQRAYPSIPLSALRVIAITVQSDSDDSRGETDVLLERLAMTPRDR